MSSSVNLSPASKRSAASPYIHEFRIVFWDPDVSSNRWLTAPVNRVQYRIWGGRLEHHSGELSIAVCALELTRWRGGRSCVPTSGRR
jgi:hypothetical protein